MTLKPLLLTLLLSAAGGSVLAQPSPVGLWRNVDDKTGEVQAEIRITEQRGVLNGHIAKSLKKGSGPDASCEECTDERKGQPIAGLEIIRGGSKLEGRNVWQGGKILDPENGKEYRATFTPIDGGSKLEVRGYLGPFWRTQTWNRAP